MAAVIKNDHLRRKKKSMDELKLATAWDSALLKDEIIMQLSGIYIQGALFESTLSDTLASSPPFSSVPKLSVAWISTVSFFLFFYCKK